MLDAEFISFISIDRLLSLLSIAIQYITSYTLVMQIVF